MRKRTHTFQSLTLAAALCVFGVVTSSAIPQQSGGQDNDTSRADIAHFDRFLDTHPQIAAELQKNPSLVNNSAYVQGHSALSAYLNDHPQIREELQENPGAFMNAEARFDQHEARGQGFGNQQRLHNVEAFDSFLDYHPEIGQQLAKDPSLIDNPGYLQDHPALRQYLQAHPSVGDQIRAHPAAFMAAEQRFDASGRDVNRAEIGTWMAFMDTHRDIAQELAKNPSLSDNANYISSHPAFQKFLTDNPGIHGELIESAQGFMTDVANYEKRGNFPPAHVNYRYPGAVTEFDTFLDSHPNIAQELYREPSLAQSSQYLANHPELQEYLQAHPNISQALAANPRGFMDQEARYDRSTSEQARLYGGMGNTGARRMDNDTTSGELRTFGGFLEDHPEIAEQLQAHPDMVNSETYINSHPELQSFLRSNPQVAEEVKENPQVFMSQLQNLQTSKTASSTSSSSTSKSPASQQQAVPKLTPNPPK